MPRRYTPKIIRIASEKRLMKMLLNFGVEMRSAV